MTLIIIFILSLLYMVLFRRRTKKDVPALYPGEIVLGFGFKVLMGYMYGYIFLKYFGGDDTWMFMDQSLEEYQKLVHQPVQFFKDLLPITAAEGAHNFWQMLLYYNSDLEYWLMPKMLAIFNIFSRGNYYINVVFFDAIAFWGPYWLFRTVATIFPSKRRSFVLLIFFFPPVVFWCSGIRAEGLLLFFTGLLIFQFNRWMQTSKKAALVYSVLALLGILIFRNVLVLLLLPALVAWFITVRMGARPLWAFAGVYILTGILFFSSTVFSSQHNLPSMVVHRQQEYFQLKGNTQFRLDSLQPTFTSFVNVLPQAANNAFLRPYFWEARGPLQYIAALDTLFIFCFLLIALFRKDALWKKYINNPVTWVLLTFAVPMYLFVGYTVPFPGAIVRYKIIGELFFLLVLAIRLKPGRGLSN